MVKSPLWAFAHHCLAHPLVGAFTLLSCVRLPTPAWVWWLHDATADRAFDDDPVDEGVGLVFDRVPGFTYEFVATSPDGVRIILDVTTEEATLRSVTQEGEKAGEPLWAGEDVG